MISSSKLLSSVSAGLAEVSLESVATAVESKSGVSTTVESTAASVFSAASLQETKITTKTTKINTTFFHFLSI
jgi:hypothetical protein